MLGGRLGGVNLVLDAGALIGIDRNDRRTAGLIELGRRSGATLVASAPVVGQAWRGSARQARLARLLAMVDVRPARLIDARAAGDLLAATGTFELPVRSPRPSRRDFLRLGGFGAAGLALAACGVGSPARRPSAGASAAPGSELRRPCRGSWPSRGSRVRARSWAACSPSGWSGRGDGRRALGLQGAGQLRRRVDDRRIVRGGLDRVLRGDDDGGEPRCWRGGARTPEVGVSQ